MYIHIYTIWTYKEKISPRNFLRLVLEITKTLKNIMTKGALHIECSIHEAVLVLPRRPA